VVRNASDASKNSGGNLARGNDTAPAKRPVFFVHTSGRGLGFDNRTDPQCGLRDPLPGLQREHRPGFSCIVRAAERLGRTIRSALAGSGFLTRTLWGSWPSISIFSCWPPIMFPSPMQSTG
jgi:hypothetical protein